MQQYNMSMFGCGGSSQHMGATVTVKTNILADWLACIDKDVPSGRLSGTSDDLGTHSWGHTYPWMNTFNSEPTWVYLQSTYLPVLGAHNEHSALVVGTAVECLRIQTTQLLWLILIDRSRHLSQ